MADAEIPNMEELAELRENPFVKRVALTTAIFAVILAVTSLGGNNAMKEMLLAQQQASNQWAYYQAKAMREHTYKLEKAKMEIDILDRGSLIKGEAREKRDDLYKTITEEEKRFRTEKKEIEKEARRFEHERDLNMKKDPYFDYAEVLLQIAIVMSSISILAGSRPIFFMSCLSAFFGTVLTFNGFLLLFRIPFLH
jgi:hypothetical protein